ncbi:MAG: patatin-like phospholipase family protein [Candidatus Berkiella sp.]
MKKWIFLLFILTNAASAYEEANHRPKIGLVLSGGGARGAAHIGAIEALEEMNVPIDFIIGTSMGAVIGGLYASGVPIEQLKHDFSKLKWDEIFSYNIKRTDLYYRRKLDTDIFVIKNFISYSNGQIHIPYGIITGQTLYELFNAYLLPRQPLTDFNQLTIPFKAVATNLVTGEPIVLDHGDMALSLLASMAVPGIISPIDRNGYLLVDGGVSANVPIEVAKKMGADILIVVDVSTPLATKDQIVDLAGVIDQLSNILTYRNEKVSKSLLTPSDILIEPQIKKIDTSDFEKFAKAIEPGRIATFMLSERLRPLATKNKCAVPAVSSCVTFDAVGIKNAVVMEDDTYLDYANFDRPTVTADEITDQIEVLYGLSIFDRINYGIQDIRNEKVLVIEPQIDQDNPIYFQASLLLDTDFNMTNTFGLVLGITNPRANSYLGEWRLLGQIGQGEGLLAEFYQPLSKDLSWFVNPSISIQRTPTIFYYNFDAIADLVTTMAQVNLALGKTFGHWGRLSGFWQYEYDDVKQETGPWIIENQYVNSGELGVILEWDTLNNLYFPEKGVKGRIVFSNFDPAYSGESHFSQVTVRNLAAVSKGKHALALAAMYNGTIGNTPNFPNKYSLGGLFELTGLSTNELLGDNSALASAVYFYELKRVEIIPNRPALIYLGASAEMGKVWKNTNLVDDRWIGSGSLFAAADTIIGPIYLAWGITDNGHKAAHLALRPAFK